MGKAFGRLARLQFREGGDQHGQQGDALAFDLDAKVERKPPAALVLDLGLPVAVGADHAMAKTLVDNDPPPLGGQFGHHVMHESRPGEGVRRAEQAVGARVWHQREGQPAAIEPLRDVGLKSAIGTCQPRSGKT